MPPAVRLFPRVLPAIAQEVVEHHPQQPRIALGLEAGANCDSTWRSGVARWIIAHESRATALKSTRSVRISVRVTRASFRRSSISVSHPLAGGAHALQGIPPRVP